jgi:hypothetical protein
MEGIGRRTDGSKHTSRVPCSEFEEFERFEKFEIVSNSLNFTDYKFLSESISKIILFQ